MSEAWTNDRGTIESNHMLDDVLKDRDGSN
ncbi:hypothetical protein OI25_5953 [Paraburkholderia fungorum]|uniref:Uncharacterized protein n=1 Tax=Paraburkholderia fungorum TaxID=134537 RepID=A0AAW3UR00_9BURK|nr:hypothetical protein OI25_5953 [Paraburkholderia fungorum]MBB4513734.1 hypothetical protein [Paraburkholderia fungorum]MBB6200975.1 hypothetical protein [Paraburkholderia fungorum]